MTTGRRLVAALAALAAFCAGLWAIWISVVGGIDVHLRRWTITSNEPLRPFVVGVAAIVVWIVARGPASVFSAWTTTTSRVNRRVVALALAGLAFLFGFAYGNRTANDADSYGYVSQAELWLANRPIVPQPWVLEVPWPNAIWTFSPLGYKPATTSASPAIVPTYSSGLPLLFAAAKRIAGHCAMFWVVPLSGAVLVLATFGIGRRIADEDTALVAAWLMFTSPILLCMLTLQMSDVPVAAAWATAFYFLFGRGVGSGLGAGLAVSCAIAIRPNLAPAVLAPVVWLIVTIVRAPLGQRSRAVQRAIAFVAAAIPGVVLVAVINQHLYGSFFESGYGPLTGQMSLANLWPNTRRYFRWLSDAQMVGSLGLIAILLPGRQLWPTVRDRSVFFALTSFTLIVFFGYAAYLVFDEWWYLRFLLPTWPFIMLGLGSVASSAFRRGGAAMALAVIGVVLFVGVYDYRNGIRRGALDQQHEGERAARVALAVGAATDPNSVVLSMMHSGSVRYYAGRMTVRYDILDPEWLDRSVDWLTAHDAHPFLLVEDWELKRFRERFAGQRATAHIETGGRSIDGTVEVHLFDLGTAPAVNVSTPLPVPAADFRCLRPASEPVVHFTK